MRLGETLLSDLKTLAAQQGFYSLSPLIRQILRHAEPRAAVGRRAGRVGQMVNMRAKCALALFGAAELPTPPAERTTRAGLSRRASTPGAFSSTPG